MFGDRFLDVENPTADGTVTRLLASARSGDATAAKDLCELLYHDLRHVARSKLARNSRLTLLDTTALVHESFLRMVGQQNLEATNRLYFLAYASTVMRSVIIDFVRKKKAVRRGGDVDFVTLDEEISDTVAQKEDDAIHLSEALDEIARVDPRAAKVVEMRYFAGMTEQEVATVLGVTERTVRRDWEIARILLKAALT